MHVVVKDPALDAVSGMSALSHKRYFPIKFFYTFFPSLFCKVSTRIYKMMILLVLLSGSASQIATLKCSLVSSE